MGHQGNDIALEQIIGDGGCHDEQRAHDDEGDGDGCFMGNGIVDLGWGVEGIFWDSNNTNSFFCFAHGLGRTKVPKDKTLHAKGYYPGGFG